MNETRTINLNGLVYHIDYDAYQNLRDYLHDIELRLPQDDRQEVMIDIEARIAELLQNALFAKNMQVVSCEMVDAVKKQIGDPSEFGPNRRPKVKVNKSQNAGCGRIFRIVLNIVLLVLALPAIFIGLFILFAIVLSLFGIAVTGSATMATIMPLVPVFADLLVDGGAIIIPLLIIALVLIVALPIFAVVYTIVTYMRKRRGPKARFWWITILFWFASFVFWGISLVRLYTSYENAPEILKMMTFQDTNVDDETGMISSTLQLDAYHSIHLTGAADIKLMNAEEPSTILTTNLMHTLMEDAGVKLNAEVRDSVLYIDVRNPLPIDELKLSFTVASPDIRKVIAYGASDIETADNQTLILPSFALDLNGAAKVDLLLDVQELSINAKGASKLELEGMAKQVNITIAGAGELEAEELIVQNMHINCSGASKAEIYVTNELWAQAAGASLITYQGTPRIKQNMAVGGSVIRKD